MTNRVKDLMMLYMDALYPIIYVNHFDFKVVDESIEKIKEHRKVIEYNNGLGIVDFKTKSTMRECDLYNFLKLVKDEGYEHDSIILLKDVHNQLDKPEIISLLKYIAERNLYSENYGATVFIASSKLCIPAELENLITVIDMPLPSVSEIKEIITDFTNDLMIDVSDEVVDEITLSFKGLNEFQVRQTLNLAYQNGGF